MAWACRLGHTRRLGRSSRGALQNWPFIVAIVLLITIKGSSALEFNCTSVKACFCAQGMRDDEFEIQCPAERREVFDITLKVKSLVNGHAFLTVICDPEKPEISSALIEGVDFSAASFAHVSEILVQYCPASSTKNPNVLKELFSQINVPLDRISTFVFLPSPKFSTAFPLELIPEMPALETLDLQKLNLTRIPDVSKLTQLKELRLRANQIASLDPETFRTTQVLQHLDLSLNNLTSLSDDPFPESLIHLNLARNDIRGLSPKTFSKLRSLQELVLTKNPLVNLHPETFSEVKGLRHLQMDSSKFEQFPKFQKLNLVEISISYRDAFSDSGSEASALTLPASASEGSGFQVIVSDMPALSKIVFVQDGLTEFPELENLPTLITLLLSGNQIKVVPPNALKNFPNLRTLDLSQNRIVTLGDIETPNLIFLDLSQNQLPEITGSVFAKLTQLETLQLKMNKIKKIDAKAFKSLSKLTNCDLSNNLLTLEEEKVEEEFPEFHDGFFTDEFDYQSPLRFSMKLEKLDLSYNQIQTIFNDWKILFADLRHLNLSHNSISFLHATSLSFSSSDLTLDISYNNISTIVMDNAEFIIEDAESRVLRVFVDGLPLNCDCNILAFRTFKMKGIYFKFNYLVCAEPIWLRGIGFRSVPPTDLICPIDTSLGCPSICECWNVPANKTIAVDCSNRNIGDSFIPDVHAINGKWAQKYDFSLNLAGNNISDLDAERSKNLSSRIVKIDLSENELRSLGFLNLVAYNNISSFYLAANKFACDDCNFHKILRSHYKQVPDYSKVSCLLETEASADGEPRMRRYFIDEFPEDQVCVMTMTGEVQAMIVAASIFLVFVIVFIAVYFRYGWALRAFLYSKGYGCCFGYDEAEEEQGKIYDAFVSYSHKDEDWVLSQLVTRLETQEGFKLCLHFRDWTPGDWIPDQIVRSVDTSRRTIVILSKHFVESVWSRLEFKAAHAQALSDHANRLILVMMDEDLKDQDVKDDDLRVYMKMNTYLKYGDPWFWHKLKYALPHKKTASAEANFLKQQQRERAIQLDKLRAKMENTISA